MPERQVLFVDDDEDLRGLVGLALQDAGIHLLCASNGLEALEIWRCKPLDLVLLDIMMPGMDGLEVCRQIRLVSNIPIILLTAKGQEMDVVQGFEAGANDYIIKPFRPKELVARMVSAMNLVPQQGAEEKLLIYQNLALDTESRSLKQDNEFVPLTSLEFRLLEYLMQNTGVVLSKEKLLKHVWGYLDVNGDTNLIEAAVRRLRVKLEADPSSPELIRTVRGVGYLFGG
jgi:two-component system response regulator MtrA